MDSGQKSVKKIIELTKLFEKNNIDWWLDTGTLLGAVREKKFISWDYDVDIGAWAGDVPKIMNIEKDIKNLGFEICYFDFKDYIKIIKPDFEIDINLYHKEKNNATRSWYINKKTTGKTIDYFLWLFSIDKPDYKKSKMPKTITKIIHSIIKKIPQNRRNKIYKNLEKIFIKIGCKKVDISIPNSFFKELTDIDFYNVKFKAPSPTEKYLEYRYGPNWRIPDKSYIFYRDDRSIIKK